MNQQKTIVITGSTRGIGFGLAEEFLKRGNAVVISGRSEESVKKAIKDLLDRHDSSQIHGQACDVTSLAEIEALWESTLERFGKVDIWINNAGLGHLVKPIWEVSPEIVQAVVNTNLLGTFYGSRVAIQGMVEQGYGQLYNMEGHGSNGVVRNGISVYGTTKAGGMVITDMITDQFQDNPEELERFKSILNIIADKVETVAPYLVERILANQQSNARITWLSPLKIWWRFLTAPFNKRDLFSE
jgi:NAD(P)-dependent dehydrogenase (short-subunit alcohol dehydrogenase family)